VVAPSTDKEWVIAPWGSRTCQRRRPPRGRAPAAHGHHDASQDDEDRRTLHIVDSVAPGRLHGHVRAWTRYRIPSAMQRSERALTKP
jgi:hypothetical protein